MAAIPCTYHPSIPASWSCAHCRMNFCAGCLPRDPQRKAPPACPSCQRHVESLGGNAIKPFWQRIPRFFAYPAKPPVLARVAGYSLLGAFVLAFPPFSLVALLVAFGLATQYGNRVLYAT